MDEFEFVGKSKSKFSVSVPQYLSLYKNGDISVTICEPDPNVDNEEVRGYWAGKPCQIFIGDGKMASQGGWTLHTDVHKKDAAYSYLLVKPLVGPLSFFETKLHRNVKDIDKNEDSKYGEFKRAFLWAEQWVSEHYPDYTILPDEMRETQTMS